MGPGGGERGAVRDAKDLQFVGLVVNLAMLPRQCQRPSRGPNLNLVYGCRRPARRMPVRRARGKRLSGSPRCPLPVAAPKVEGCPRAAFWGERALVTECRTSAQCRLIRAQSSGVMSRTVSYLEAMQPRVEIDADLDVP